MNEYLAKYEIIISVAIKYSGAVPWRSAQRKFGNPEFMQITSGQFPNASRRI